MLTVTTIGHIGQDATLRHLDQGGIVCSFSVASKTYARGEYVTTWCDVALFGKRGESLVAKLTKGAQVAVSGTAYMQKTDRGSFFKVRADEVALLDKPAQPQGGSSDTIPF